MVPRVATALIRSGVLEGQVMVLGAAMLQRQVVVLAACAGGYGERTGCPLALAPEVPA
jgi:hypothetical protein